MHLLPASPMPVGCAGGLGPAGAHCQRRHRRWAYTPHGWHMPRFSALARSASPHPGRGFRAKAGRRLRKQQAPAAQMPKICRLGRAQGGGCRAPFQAPRMVVGGRGVAARPPCGPTALREPMRLTRTGMGRKSDVTDARRPETGPPPGPDRARHARTGLGADAAEPPPTHTLAAAAEAAIATIAARAAAAAAPDSAACAAPPPPPHRSRQISIERPHAALRAGPRVVRAAPRRGGAGGEALRRDGGRQEGG